MHRASTCRREGYEVCAQVPSVAKPFVLLGLVVVSVAAGLLLIWPFWGYEPLVLSLSLSVACLAGFAGGFAAAWRDGARGMEGRRQWGVLLVVTALLTAVAAAGTVNLLTQPRWTGAGQWAECARFATVGPGEAVQRAAAGLGLDLHEFHATVKPVFINETGWEFEATCDPAPAPGLPLVVHQGLPPDAEALYLWSVSYHHDYELLGGSAWVNWDTGACVFGCAR